MIPKIIHYCWFGDNPLPELAVKCIDSWRKYFPDYEIKEWNESNFDLNCCDYVREAYEVKKWAFVSDYARFWILYNFGGLYFDTDVEIIKDMSDIVEKGSFMGCEPVFSGGLGVNPGLGLAAAPGLGLYKEILDDYENSHFFDLETGKLRTVVMRVTDILKKYDFDGKNEIKEIKEVYFYPPEYFCPLDYTTGNLTITENTYSIHHYMATWQTKVEEKIIKICQKYAAQGKSGCLAEKLQTLPLRIKNKMDCLGFIGTVKFAVKKVFEKV